VQGHVEGEDRRMVCRSGTEGTRASPSKVAMKRRKNGVKSINPVARGELKPGAHS
jgi:hypothetical protein